jgi:hypothetical protein
VTKILERLCELALAILAGIIIANATLPTPKLIGRGCEVGQPELRDLYANSEDDLPVCTDIVRLR